MLLVFRGVRRVQDLAGWGLSEFGVLGAGFRRLGFTSIWGFGAGFRRFGVYVLWGFGDCRSFGGYGLGFRGPRCMY